MSVLNISLTPEAEDALAAIYRYSEDRWGAKRAGRYLDDIEKAFALLAKNPRLGHSHPVISSLYGAYPVGSHLIVYRADDETLHIVAVMHMSMDIEYRMASLAQTDKGKKRK